LVGWLVVLLIGWLVGYVELLNFVCYTSEQFLAAIYAVSVLTAVRMEAIN
jgi:hypothetical protein